jgi:hypothetical protein
LGGKLPRVIVPLRRLPLLHVIAHRHHFPLRAPCRMRPFYGVESRATFNGPVDVECANAALANVPEAGPETYQRREDRSTEILPKQRKVLTIAHDSLYGEGGVDILEIIQGPTEPHGRRCAA